VLPLDTLPATAPDLRTFADAVAAVDDTASACACAAAQLEAMVHVLVCRRHLPGDVRVPLDVRQPAVTSLPWRPFQVSEVCVSSQSGLLRFMRFSARLSERTQCRVSPVLVNENIHYRMHKVAWSFPFLRWDVTRFMRVVPPLFGVWHAYKYCVTQVARRLHSCLWFAIRGTMAEGTHVPTGPPLRAYELAFAGLLQLPLTLREHVVAVRTQCGATPAGPCKPATRRHAHRTTGVTRDGACCERTLAHVRATDRSRACR